MSNGDNKDDLLPPDGMNPPEGNGNGEEAPLNSGRPAVASAPGKMLFVLIFAGIFIFIVIRSLFFGGEPAPEKGQPHQKEHVDAAKTPSEMALTPGALPAPPPESLAPPLAPPAPPPAPPPPLPTSADGTVPEVHMGKGPTNEVLQARIKSPMIISSGNGAARLLQGGQQTRPAGSNDPNIAFAQGLSSAERVEAGSIGNLNITIAQGKLIHAVLETAINSDLPGVIRAIVSHDTYAESGRAILIPKGSRLIGTYNSSVRRGQGRVFIIWTRVIRPDGIDVAINSPGVDALGRAGLAGDLDNKYFEAFSSALLTSALDIGVAYAGDKIVGSDQTTQSTTAAGPTTTTTGSAGSAGVSQAVNNIGDVGKSIVSSAVNLQPTINVDQGTAVEVFVNKDLVFPSDVTRQSHFVQ